MNSRGKIKKVPKTFPGVAERADFSAAYEGESYVTLTFRVPKDTPALAGIWDLTPRKRGTFDWATTKNVKDSTV